MQRKILGLIIFIIMALALNVEPLITSSETTGTQSPIKHVIEILMENHTFDNLFGAYSTNHPLENLTTSIILQNKLKPVPIGTYSTPNPPEGYVAYHRDWNNGAMNGFMSAEGPVGMTYFTAAQLAPEWSLAQEYGLADHFFVSTLRESNPNYLYNYAAYSPVLNDYGPPPYIPVDQSIFYQLSLHNISWGYYAQNIAQGIGAASYFSGIHQYSSHLQNWKDFLGQLQNNTLPAVSWVFSSFGGSSGYNQHPPDNVLVGEMWILYLIQSIMQSPEWSSTAIFLTYDDSGGYYDHVAPPSIDGHQLGFRAPLIVISPYAKENYVSHTVLSHPSILGFIDWNWNLQPLNSFVAHSNLPLDFFNFSMSPRAPLDLSPLVPLIPASIPFNQKLANNFSDVSSFFPLPPQLPYSSLTYSLTVSSNTTLLRLGISQLFVTSNSTYSPFYESELFLSVIFVGLIVVLNFL